MPLYEYQCTKCEALTEQIQKFSDPPLEICPKCGGQLKKKMAQTSFVLKGTGWYTTDYKRASKPSSNGNTEKKAESSPAPKKESSTQSSSSESKSSS